MNPIHVMVNGLPGRIAREVAAGILRRPERFNLVPFSLCGPEIEQRELSLGDGPIRLVPPDKRESLPDFAAAGHAPVAVDFTVPGAVESNVDFYCRRRLPFVLGTTGGDYAAVQARVAQSDVCAVAAPNMSIPILLVVAAFDHLAKRFAGALAGWNGEIVESHQATKRDTSGTAKLMVGYLQQLGIQIDMKSITQIRDPQTQRTQLGVPEEHLGGHAYHTYTLRSSDRSVELKVTHNVLGRATYVEGTLAAIQFVAERHNRGVRGMTYTMLDVLQSGGPKDDRQCLR